MKTKALFAVLAAAAILFGISQSADAVIISEDFSSDPGWDGFNNRTAPQDFGFSDTSNAGGTQGEAGGNIIRDPLAHYADDVGVIDPSTTSLVMRGSAVFGANSGNVMVGWFDRTADLRWDFIQDFIGFRTDDNKLIEVLFRGRENRFAPTNGMGEALDGAPIDVDVPFTYVITYTPTGGANNGGILNATFANVSIPGRTDSTYTLQFEPSEGNRDAIADLNRHGLLSLYIPGSGAGTEFFIDDLRYTSAIPEPASLILLAWGGLALVVSRRRRTK